MSGVSSEDEEMISVNGEAFSSPQPQPSGVSTSWENVRENEGTWKDEYLFDNLKDPDAEEDDLDRNNRFMKQFLKASVAFFLLLISLTCHLSSKLSFLSLAEASRSFQDDEKGRIAVMMLILVLLLPQGMSLVAALYGYSRQAKISKPEMGGMLFTVIVPSFILVCLEVTGLTTFTLVVAPRIHATVILCVMIAVFSVQGIIRTFSRDRRNRRSVQRSSRNSSRSEVRDLLDAEESRIRGESFCFPKGFFQSPVYRILKFIGAVGQVGVLVLIPLVIHQDDWISSTLGMEKGVFLMFCLGSVVCLSFAWLPKFQDKITLRRDLRGNSVQTNVSLFAGVLRLGLSIVAVAVITQYDNKLSKMEINAHLLKRLYHYRDLFVPFMVNLLGGFIGHHAGKLACQLTIPIWGYAIPLALATPAAAFITFIGLDIPFNLSVHEYAGSNLPLLIITVGVAWLSEFLISAETAWNTHIPSLARVSTLFYQPSYCGPMLEAYDLLNRRPAVHDIALFTSRSLREEIQASKVYCCSTMYNENKEEMRQLFRSILNMDSESAKMGFRNVFESHVFMDGGVVNGAISPKASELIWCVATEVKSKEGMTRDKFDIWLRQGRRFVTPYGLRIEWPLPDHCGEIVHEDRGSFPFVIHLKDPKKVKNKKRWSQCMYLYYFSQFRNHETHGQDLMSRYILTTDADVKFTLYDIIPLIMLLARHDKVGGVCGRTYPLGSGPLVWYQIFDYTIGHWFQKTAEHVLGTVLCCPGCFSLYRVRALRDVIRNYSSAVENANHFLIKDMGEDRWMCTLLVLAKWRLDYTAASRDYTYCPDSFNEFFNQRRRWVPSTLANIIELLKNWNVARRTNDSVSHMFLVYQAMMLLSSILSPSNVLLVIAGGIKMSMGGSLIMINCILFGVTLMFLAVCLCCKESTQLFTAKILTGIFALVMGSVLIGIAKEIADEQNKHDPSSTTTTTTPAPNGSHYFDYHDAILHAGHKTMGLFSNATSYSTIYLAMMAALFGIAGLMHGSEVLYLVHGIWYLLCLPGGYLFLFIYSICNLHVRSWGTRVSKEEKKTAEQAWTSTFWHGCGRRKDEPLLHFLGRVICCHVPALPVDVEAPAAKTDSPQSTQPGSAQDLKWTCKVENKVCIARCPAVENLLQMITSGQPLDRNEMRATMMQAIAACPSIACDADQPLDFIWDFKEKTFKNGAVTPRNLEKLRDLINRVLDRFYRWEIEDVEEDPNDSEHIKATEQFVDSVLDTNETTTPVNKHCIAAIKRNLLNEGYEDTSYVVMIKEKDLKDMGLMDSMEGTALCKKLMKSIVRLPKTHIPRTVPRSVSTWLRSIQLFRYRAYFAHRGIGDADVDLLQGITEKDLKDMGIDNPAHLRKLKESLEKITQLFKEGIAPEDSRRSRREEEETHTYVRCIQQKESLKDSYLLPSNDLGGEENFWKNLIEEVLDPKIDPIDNRMDLAGDLLSLRNTTVLGIVVANTLWILFIVELASSNIKWEGNNPLGLIFLIVFGLLTVLQFLSLVLHRLETLQQIVSSV